MFEPHNTRILPDIQPPSASKVQQKKEQVGNKNIEHNKFVHFVPFFGAQAKVTFFGIWSVWGVPPYFRSASCHEYTDVAAWGLIMLGRLMKMPGPMHTCKSACST